MSDSALVSICQPSDGAEGQGQGQLLIKTVKLAFSVTNNVIRLKPPSNVVSPLEQALTQHGMSLCLGETMPARVHSSLQCASASQYFLRNSLGKFSLLACLFVV